MNYTDALNLLNKNEHLLGKVLKGKGIDEIFIYPTDDKSFEEFRQTYVLYQSPQIAIAPYISQDVKVGVLVEKKNIQSLPFLPYIDILELDPEFGVIL